MVLYWWQSLLLLCAAPPRFRNLWTYCGVVITSGLFTGLIGSYVVHPVVSEYSDSAQVLLAAPIAVCVLRFMLKRMGFSHPFVVAFGCALMGVPHWPTTRIEFLPYWAAGTLFVMGAIISLPVFIREIKVIEWQEKRPPQ
jgi:hypothetical protein